MSNIRAHIKVVVEMSLDEAVQLKEYLGTTKSPNAADGLWSKLCDTLDQAREAVS